MKIKQVRSGFNAEIQYENWTFSAETELECVEAAYDRVASDPEYSEQELYFFHLFSDENGFIGEFYLAGGA